MKKRMLSLLLALVLALSLLPAGVLAADGAGTKDDPLQLQDAADLAAFRDRVNGGENGLCARLEQDIQLSGSWTPIAATTLPGEGYAGVFDGNGKTIRGLSVSGTTMYQGLFGIINGAEIKGLTVEGQVSSTSNYVGGIVGKAFSGKLTDCAFLGTVSTSKSGGTVGGIAGYIGNGASQTVAVSGCANGADVTGGCVGGIAGYAKFSTITDCLSTGAISGTGNTGGIVGQSMNQTAVKNCCSTEVVKSSGSAGGIVGFNGASVTNCYWLAPDNGAGGGAGTVDAASAQVSSTAGLAEKLGSAFQNEEDGSLRLSWQGGAAKPQPRIELTGASLLYQDNSGTQPQTTLTAAFRVMDAQPVVWSAEGGAVTLETPENPGENNLSVIVHAAAPGTATVTAAAGEVTALMEITVVPYVTTVEIENVSQPGAVAVGQTVQARVFVLGGGEYDYAQYPALSWQWYHGTEPVQGATARSFEIPDSFTEWDKLGVSVLCGGRVVHSCLDQQASVRSADYGRLYPIAYDRDFTLPAEVKTDEPLTLPTQYRGASVVWSSSSGAIAPDGTVTRPAEGTQSVTLTAKYTLGSAYANRTFGLTVWSDAAIEVDAKDRQGRLERDVEAALGSWYRLCPVYGTDENVLTMVRDDLKAGGLDGVEVTLASAEELSGGAAIAPDGTVTYFYADPNNAPVNKFGSFRANLVFARDGVTAEKAVAVTVYWDRARVEQVMRDEILSQVELDTDRPVTEELSLPCVVGGRRWTLIS